ncbi:MAG: M55 family metallopeptidase [Phycisphaerae bacterium]|jgi:D-amino peptidase
MNVFISADIEGICGVMQKLHWDPAGSEYKRACEWMAEEVNAAVRGALAGGARRVVVKDSHYLGTNIRLDQLHPAAELISGWGHLHSMVEGVDATFNALFLIGYHARGGTVMGTLAHTWSSNLLDLRINDAPVGESGWAAAFAGHFGVPVALVSGDDQLRAQVAGELPPGFQFVQTKIGWGYNAAHSRPIPKVREELEAAARKAVEVAASLRPFKPALPMTVTMRFRHWEGLHACSAVPGVERLSFDTFRFQAADAIEAQKYFVTLHRLARPET